MEKVNEKYLICQAKQFKSVIGIKISSQQYTALAEEFNENQLKYRTGRSVDIHWTEERAEKGKCLNAFMNCLGVEMKLKVDPEMKGRGFILQLK